MPAHGGFLLVQHSDTLEFDTPLCGMSEALRVILLSACSIVW
jgi:hypothetical protein